MTDVSIVKGQQVRGERRTGSAEEEDDQSQNQNPSGITEPIILNCPEKQP
jgi:hypothetical protein